MSTFTEFYKKPTIALIVAIVLGGLIGYHDSGVIGAAITSAMTVIILSILEISMSFDNAVLNAKILKPMSDAARNWFMLWGILIAVVGMRLLVPVLIVSAVGSMAPWTAFMIALTNPSQYSTLLTSSADYVSAFGGSFLMMVALNFFLGDEKETNWLHFLEVPLAKLAKLEVVITLLVVILAALGVNHDRQFTFVMAGSLGIMLNIAIGVLKEKLEEHAPEAAQGVAVTIKSAIASLIYLEVLDASMSFDGVIGAFAITTEIFLVMLGLGVGAMFVRGMTINLVKNDTMAEYRYLEHGALWSIAVLAAIMFIKVNHHVPELFTGLISAAIIAIAVVHSHILNKREASSTATTLVDYKPEVL
jgi:hypothetical protein